MLPWGRPARRRKRQRRVCSWGLSVVIFMRVYTVSRNREQVTGRNPGAPTSPLSGGP